MNLNDIENYNFELPTSLIAHNFLDQRTDSKLLICESGKPLRSELSFTAIKKYLRSDDFLILNQTKVRKSRLIGTGFNIANNSYQVEVLILELFKDDSDLYRKNSDLTIWKCIGKPMRKIKRDREIIFTKYVSARILKSTINTFYISFFKNNTMPMNDQDCEYFFEEHGEVPFPPYIKSPYETFSPKQSNNLSSNSSSVFKSEFFEENENFKNTDNNVKKIFQNKPFYDKIKRYEDRYQTCFAKRIGSSASPTASLHFSKELIEEIQKMGVNLIFLTLHIGLGTFKPIESKSLESVSLHSESYFIDQQSSDLLNQALLSKKSIICVGTTSLRALEDNFRKNNKIVSGHYKTDLFIKPPDKPSIINGLITNFHLPKSTLFVLVASLLGLSKIHNVYQYAIQNKYRFYSLGDAMFIRL